MKKYRIVEIKKYDKTIFHVERRFLWIWYEVPKESYGFTEFYDFDYFSEAMDFILRKNYKDKKTVLFHIDVIGNEKFSVYS